MNRSPFHGIIIFPRAARKDFGGPSGRRSDLGRWHGNRTHRKRAMADNKNNPNTLSLPFVEALYAEYLREPSGIPAEWRRYFEQIAESNGFAAHPALGPSFPRRGLYGPGGRARENGSRVNAIIAAGELEPSFAARVPEAPGATAAGSSFVAPQTAAGAASAFSLIQSYRARGHLAARIDPLGAPRPEPPDLDPAFHGFGDADLDAPVSDTFQGRVPATLRISSPRCARSTPVRSAFSTCTSTTSRCSNGSRSVSRATRARGAASARARAPHPHPAHRRGDLRGVHPEEVRRARRASRSRAPRA